MNARLVGCLIVGLAIFSAAAHAAVFTVTNTSNSGAGSLRTALTSSNANGVADTITFAGALSGKTIRPTSALPALTDGALTIDGDIDDDGKPDLCLDGVNLTGNGLDVKSSGNTVRGLRIIRCAGWAVNVQGGGATGNTVAGCWIGVDATGRFAYANGGGVLLSTLASNNTVGGNATFDRNLISGNVGAGITIASASNNQVLGNFIGVDVTGARALGNGAGVVIGDSDTCKVGNNLAGGRNVIAGNRPDPADMPKGPAAAGDEAAVIIPTGSGGITITGGRGHVIAGNRIGTTADGTTGLPSGGGITVFRSSDVVVGGSLAGTRNLISSLNTDPSTLVFIDQSRNVKVQGNYVGLDLAGEKAITGAHIAVHLQDSTSCLVGGSAAGERNILVHRPISGGDIVEIDGGSANSVFNNYIGTNATGQKGLLSSNGVRVTGGALNTQIGGAAAATGNLISGLRLRAVILDDGVFTKVSRNVIGYHSNGFSPLPNGGTAIQLARGSATIGGTTAELGNRISMKSGLAGIMVSAELPVSAQVQRNRIFGLTTSPGGGGVAFTSPTAQAITGRIADNQIRRCNTGIVIEGAGTRPVVFHNTLSFCSATAISVSSGARPNLGDLGNAPTNDDGKNVFRDLTQFAVMNVTENDIKAEGNDWGTTAAATIDGTLVFDELDSSSFGRVDYDPLIGGVAPTGGTENVLHVTGLTALPAGPGAEIAYSLSAPGEVTAEVLNVGGRSIATLPPRPGAAGLNRLTWSGLSAAGTSVPSGTYLVRIVAHSASGAQSSALTTLSLRR